MTFVSLLYILLAILGLSFLIFIHELGHYYMARRVGMRVETFSIGFGKPIYSWMKDGVKWQIGWLLFGGYVKISGMDTATSDQTDPYTVKDGFYSKSPWDRIKVAFMGPLVNIVFALLAFTALWFLGGREKNFSDYTHKIGWLDPHSELYAKGIRPGDEIVSYNGQPLGNSKEHLTAPLMAGGNVDVKGQYVNFFTKEKQPFEYTLKPYTHPRSLDKEIVTIGVFQPASYVIYNKFPDGKENPLPKGSPMKESGVQYGDRVVWVDGTPIYSVAQLNHVLNESKALLTIKRGDQTLLRRVPRVLAEELKWDAEFKEELIDWQFEAELNQVKIQKLYMIPYNLNNEGVVEAQVKFIDLEKEEEVFSEHPSSPLESPLQKNDQIIAIDGVPVTHSYEILAQLQQRYVNIIVERDDALAAIPSWEEADQLFDQRYRGEDLFNLVSKIGVAQTPQQSGNLVLLNAVAPKTHKDFQLNPEIQTAIAEEMNAQKRELEMIEDPEKRAQAIQALESRDKQLLLGLPAIQDERVQYNPDPLKLFGNVFEEIWHTLKALFTGSLSPKWMSGPIGIVQVMHDNSMVSLKESLFWLGAISLNLGVLNLLPLPVLDGGSICFALFELVTGRKLKAKTLEKLIIPFALLLIGLFVFLTYHDLSRIFGG